jgi:hypothetical protein
MHLDYDVGLSTTGPALVLLVSAAPFLGDRGSSGRAAAIVSK